MNKLHVRRSSKKGITPVIATIILIAGTLVLALVVGAYTFGLFGTNVKNVQLTAANLSSGPNVVASTTTPCAGANFAMTFNNPGGSTYISGLSLSAGGVSQSLTYYATISNACTQMTVGTNGIPSTPNGNVLNAGGTTQITIYFANGTPGTSGLASGTTYTYTITFFNGQSITGALVAQ
jgi:flagellin-like protein